MEFRRTYLAVVVGAIVTIPAVAQFSLPPISYSGSLRSAYRLDYTGEGSKTSQVGNSGNVNLRSFIWRPWFATWSGGLSFSRSTTTTESSETVSDVMSGNLSVNLFPRSQFPARLYLTYNNGDTEGVVSGVDAGTTSSGYSYLSFGASQNYSPRDGGLQYNGVYTRAIATNKESDLSTISDDLTGEVRGSADKQSFSGSLSLRNFQNEEFDNNDFQMELIGDHTYRPTPDLFIESGAEIFHNTISSGGNVASQRSDLRAASSLRWRDPKRPLNANLRASFDAAIDWLSEESAQGLNLNGSLTYRFSDQLTGSASAGIDFDNGDDFVYSTTQSVGVGYSPEGFDLLGFRYGWNASAGIGTSTDVDGKFAGRVSGGIGHSISRAIELPRLGGASIAVSGSQALSSSVDMEGLFTGTLSSNLSANAQHANEMASSSVNGTVSHVMVFAETPTQVVTLNVLGNHARKIGRYMQARAKASLGAAVVSTDGVWGDVTQSSSIGLQLDHNRFLKINNLTFTSLLEMDSEDLIPYDFTGEGTNVAWENDLEYKIGRLNVKMNATVSKSGEEPPDKSIFISTVRSF